MKRLFILLSLLFCSFAYADTINLHWLNYDGTSYQDSTCVIDSDLILPSTTPTRYGYTFTGWRMSRYTPIEYLKSTGTQYIDTGIYVNSDYVVEVKGIFNCGQIPCGQEGASFGSGHTGPVFVLAIACSSEGSNWGDYSINSTAAQLGINNVDSYTLKIDKNGIYTDGVKKLGFPEYNAKTYASRRFLLFGTKAQHYGYSSDTIIYLKIWDDNNVLVRNFIPVLDENNISCLFDTVEGKFYYNQGSGNFVAGPVLSE